MSVGFNSLYKQHLPPLIDSISSSWRWRIRNQLHVGCGIDKKTSLSRMYSQIPCCSATLRKRDIYTDICQYISTTLNWWLSQNVYIRAIHSPFRFRKRHDNREETAWNGKWGEFWNLRGIVLNSSALRVKYLKDWTFNIMFMSCWHEPISCMKCVNMISLPKSRIFYVSVCIHGRVDGQTDHPAETDHCWEKVKEEVR